MKTKLKMCLRFVQVLKFGGKRGSECKMLEGKGFCLVLKFSRDNLKRVLHQLMITASWCYDNNNEFRQQLHL